MGGRDEMMGMRAHRGGEGEMEREIKWNGRRRSRWVEGDKDEGEMRVSNEVKGRGVGGRERDGVGGKRAP